MESPLSIKLVVFDWAGTTVDHGCFAPVAAFIESLARYGVAISVQEARAPMGLYKKDHLRAIAQMPEVAQRWRTARRRDWAENDIDEIYSRHFVPLQLERVVEHSQLVPGLLGCVARLRERGIKIGATTGYFREAARRVYASAREQGYEPDCNVCADDVPAARPAPWMIFRNMEVLHVYPPSAVVKVGDTVADMGEARNAGVWAVGVTHTGSEVGCTKEDFAALAADQRKSKVDRATKKLIDAGAHYVIDSVVDLPELLGTIEARLAGQPVPNPVRVTPW